MKMRTYVVEVKTANGAECPVDYFSDYKDISEYVQKLLNETNGFEIGQITITRLV